jgi:hypothetical protein
MEPTSTHARSWNTVEWLRSITTVAIPVYQREYRWTQSTCEQLLTDIFRVADAEEVSSHFIGSVLAAVDGDELTLVDGQQRITTLMLMLAAIRELATTEDPSLAADVTAIVMQPDPSRGPKLRPHERYVDVLARLLTDTQAAAGDSAFEANYVALVEMIGDNWRRAWQGMRRLEHVTIGLDARANAQQIFESLNSTGARLSDDELIHNYVHMGRVHSEQLELERATWLPIEQSTRGAVREFWRDYLVWSSTEQPDVSGEFGIYRAFRHRYRDPRVDLTPDIQVEWVKHASWYGTLLEPSREGDPDVATQLRRVRSFEATPRPLLLGMYGHYAERRIDKETFITALEQLQTMLVRRALVNLERDIGMIGRLCRELRGDGYPLEGFIRRTPEDAQVRLALSHGSLPHAGYVLSRLQRPAGHLRDLQIEHIYPQNPRPDWSGDGGVSTWGDLPTERQAEYRTVLNTVGNLTLLEAPLNQGASNRPFHEKVASYYARSDIGATKALEDHAGAWDYAAIKARTDELTAEFLRIWPRPTSAPMDQAHDLVRVVDLPLVGVRGYPTMFEYAIFEDAMWGDVKNVKQLLVKVAHELWTRDPDLLLSTEHGHFLRTKRSRGKSHERLPSGLYLYTGWANQYLLQVAQEFISAFAFDDSVRVRLVDPLDASD